VCGGILDAFCTWNVLLTQTWNTYCVTIPQDAQPGTSITFNGTVSNLDDTVSNATAFILIDHVVPAASCP
jgi:hypothetical protein